MSQYASKDYKAIPAFIKDDNSTDIELADQLHDLSCKDKEAPPQYSPYSSKNSPDLPAYTTAPNDDIDAINKTRKRLIKLGLHITLFATIFLSGFILLLAHNSGCFSSSRSSSDIDSNNYKNININDDSHYNYDSMNDMMDDMMSSDNGDRYHEMKDMMNGY